MINKTKKHSDKDLYTYAIIALFIIWGIVWCLIFKNIYDTSISTEKKSLPKQDSSLVQTHVPPNESTVDQKFITLHNVPLDIKTQLFVQDLCNKYDFNIELVYGIMYVESRFNNTVTNGYCVGIMQTDTRYMNTWLRGETWSTELEKNIIAGVKALASWRGVCESKGIYDNVYYLLGTYNQGNTYFNSPNNEYAHKVIDYANSIEKYIFTEV